MSIANPPPYSNITGIAKSVNNYVDNVTANAYNGNARPGELVVSLDTFNLYVGDDNGNLLLLSSGSGSDPAGGSDTQIQYNKNGVLAGDTHFTYDDNLHKVTLGGLLDLSELAVSVVSTDLIPSSNVALSLGNATNQWRDLWISNNTIYINSIPISLTANNDLTVDGNPVVTADPGNGATNVSSLDVSGALGAQTASVSGNITTANYFIGDGGFISNINASNIGGLYTDANATALLANLGANTISSTGAITAGYFVGDGANLTGLPAGYSNTQAAEFLANLDSNVITTSGNITAGYFIGDGSQLTGLPASYGNANLANIGSNAIGTTGNITAGYFIGDGSQLTGLPAGYSNSVAAAFLAALGANSISTTGSVTAAHLVGEGGNISNIQWANINGTPALYSNTNVAAFLPTYTGNITANNIVAGANITGNMILGNGALLSGLPAGYSNSEAAAYFASGNVTSTISTQGSVVANTIASTANLLIIDPLNDGNQTTGDVRVLGNLSVTGNVTYVDVSTAVTSNLQWTAAANANTPAAASGGGLEVGNAAAPYATWLYNSTANAWVSNIAIVAQGGANINGALTGATTGAFSSGVTAARFSGEGGNISNIQWANITGAPTLYSNANATALLANLGANTISSTGTITGARFLGEGGNLSNIQWSNVTGANAGIAAYLPTYTGNITANNIVANNTITAQTFVGNFQGNISGNIVVPGSNTWVLFNNNGNAGANAGFTFNSATGVATATYFSGGGGNLSNIQWANITNVPTLYSNTNAVSLLANLGANTISSTGTITGANIRGEGGNLSNIQYANITGAYGNSNVAVYLASGTDTANINTSGNLISANTLVLTGAGAAAAADTITSSGQNGLSIGTANTSGVVTLAAAANSPVRFTVLSDVTSGVTNSGAVWVQGGLNVWKSLNVGGNIYTTGNISAALFTGNGSGLTNVTAVTAQTVTTNAQPNITSVGVLTALSVSGATTAGSLSLGTGNLSLTGNTIKTTANLITIDPLGDGLPSTGDVSILGNLSVTGNLTYVDVSTAVTSNLQWTAAANATTPAQASGGGLEVGNAATPYATWLYNSTANSWVSNINISAAGNVTATAFAGNGATLSSLTGANVAGNVPSAIIANTVTNPAQSNITSVGTLTSLNVTGIISTAGNIKGEGGNLSNITGANVTGNVPSAIIANTVTNPAQGNITSVGTLTSLNVTGIISTAGNIKGEGGNISNITGVNVTGNVPSATIANTVTNPAQPNITSVGILTSVSVSGNAVAGNFNTAGLVSATGNVVGGNVTTIGLISATGNVTGGNLNTAGLASVTGNVQAGNLRTAGLISATGNITGNGSLAIGTTITALPNTVATFGGNVDSYLQINLQNISSGANAESDFVVTADNGSDTVNYINMGIVNSAYDPATPTNSLGNIIYPTDGYLYAQGNVGNTSANGGNLAIGTTVSSKVVRIFAGGNTASNIVAVFSSDKITLGAGAGQTDQSSNAIAIGHMAGQSSQGNDAIAIGRQAGQTSQVTAAIGIGIGAGYSSQNGHAIAIGTNSGFMSQSLQSLAIGYNAASVSQAGNAIAIGSFAGASLQGNNAIAIGAMPNINNVSQGAGAISIGANAAANSQTANSIVINASGTAITASNTGFYAAPVRFDPANVGNSVYYNTVTKELTYASPQITTMDYIHVVRTTNQSWNSANAAVLFDSTVSSSSTIGYNSATGVFTLTAGKTYRLAAGIPLDAAGGYNSFQWQYSGNTTPISSAKGVAATTSYGASSIEIVFTPTATTTVALKSLMSVGSTVYGGAWAVVQQLANSAVTTDLYLTGNITANTIGGYVGGNSVTLLNYKDSVYSLPYAATLTPDPALGSIQTVTLTGNVTLNNFGGTPQAGQSITMKIIQDATGNRILTSTMKWAGGFKTLSTTANAIDIATIWFDGTTYFGSLTRGYQ